MHCVEPLIDQIVQIMCAYYCHHQLLLSSFIHLILTDNVFKLNKFYSDLAIFSYLLCIGVTGLGACDMLIYQNNLFN
jgi:hypothetical protein